jgi:hypothetical protein
MAKLDWNKWPTLKAYLEEYGMSTIDKMFDIKSKRGIEAPGIVAAVAWREENGQIDYCTVEFYDGEWHMANDGHEPIDEKKWKKAYLPNDCNWVEFRE